MLKHLLAVFIVATFAFASLSAQELSPITEPTLTPQNSGTTNGLIAVSPVNPQVVWASGRAGTFTVTTDGGQTWKAGVVPGAETLQFRDVQGFSAKVAYLMSIGTSSDPGDFRIYKTEDGGATWTLQFQNPAPRSLLRLLRVLDAWAGYCAKRLGERGFPHPAHHRWNNLAGHQRQHAAGVAGGRFLSSEWYVRCHARWPECLGCDRRLVDRQDSGHARWRRHLERV